MVKITVFYNLGEGVSQDSYLAWRTTEHERDNAAMPEVLRTDFYIARDIAGAAPLYRYITEAYFPDMETVERSFLCPEVQDPIRQQIRDWRLEDFHMIISEERSATDNA